MNWLHEAMAIGWGGQAEDEVKFHRQLIIVSASFRIHPTKARLY